MMCSIGTMPFPDQLAFQRRTKRLTQAAFAEACGISKPMVQRYEAGTSQPTLDVIKKMAVVLGISSDALLFEPSERGPDDDLRLQFEAIARLDPDEKQVVKAVLESLIIRHDAGRWTRTKTKSA